MVFSLKPSTAWAFAIPLRVLSKKKKQNMTRELWQSPFTGRRYSKQCSLSPLQIRKASVKVLFQSWPLRGEEIFKPSPQIRILLPFRVPSVIVGILQASWSFTKSEYSGFPRTQWEGVYDSASAIAKYFHSRRYWFWSRKHGDNNPRATIASRSLEQSLRDRCEGFCSELCVTEIFATKITTESETLFFFNS